MIVEDGDDNVDDGLLMLSLHCFSKHVVYGRRRGEVDG